MDEVLRRKSGAREAACVQRGGGRVSFLPSGWWVVSGRPGARLVRRGGSPAVTRQECAAGLNLFLRASQPGSQPPLNPRQSCVLRHSLAENEGPIRPMWLAGAGYREEARPRLAAGEGFSSLGHAIRTEDPGPGTTLPARLPPRQGRPPVSHRAQQSQQSHALLPALPASAGSLFRLVQARTGKPTPSPGRAEGRARRNEPAAGPAARGLRTKNAPIRTVRNSSLDPEGVTWRTRRPGRRVVPEAANPAAEAAAGVETRAGRAKYPTRNLAAAERMDRPRSECGDLHPCG
jgi:hypothetical protein